jgi:glutamate 5-kinase
MEISPARARLAQHKRAVVKIGTTSLRNPNGTLAKKRISKLCSAVSDICKLGKEIILVTSGAVGVGAKRLDMARPSDIIGRQAASAVGQAILMQVYIESFLKHKRKVAQLLLSRDCVNDSLRRENAHNTMRKLLDMGVIPIVNANDTIATDELDELSDNDNLSAYVADFSDSDLLIILSDIEGLFDKDPRAHRKAVLFHEINQITPKMETDAGGSGSAFGTGGMVTKLNAARYALERGIDTVIAPGKDPTILLRIFDGEEEGTLFTNLE